MKLDIPRFFTWKFCQAAQKIIPWDIINIIQKKSSQFQDRGKIHLGQDQDRIKIGMGSGQDWKWFQNSFNVVSGQV